MISEFRRFSSAVNTSPNLLRLSFIIGIGLILLTLPVFLMTSEESESQGSAPAVVAAGESLPSTSRTELIRGMSRVEVQVRSSARARMLVDEVRRGEIFDLYFAYSDPSGKPKVAIVYRRLIPAWISESGESIGLDVDEGDVSEIVALEMAGEFRLIRSAGDPDVGESESEEPLGERDWVVALVGHDPSESAQ